MDTVVLDCGNCGARVSDFPREKRVHESIARIVAGGCPECLAFGPDRYFDGMGRELDGRTWQPVPRWLRVLRDFTSARVPGAIGASLAGGGTAMAKAGKTAFDEFFKRAVEHEGKVVEDVPGDAGGPTKWGITIGRLATRKGVKLPRRGSKAWDALKAELYALTEAQIRDFYKRDYWDVVRADNLPPGIAYCVADYGLNSGPSRAIKALQMLCGNKQTGRMDDETIREAHAFDRVELIMLYQEERARFLNAIVSNRPNQRKFLKGWMNRVGDVKRAAIAMAESAPPVEVPALPLPKAVEPEPPKPSIAKEAVKSKSVWLLLSVILGKVGNFFFGIFEMIGSGLSSVVEVLGPAQQEAETTIAPLMSLTQTLRLNLGEMTIWLTVFVLTVVLFRHLKDKVALAIARWQAGEPA